MLKIIYTKSMKKDAKRVTKRGKNLAKLNKALTLLAQQVDMPAQYKDHQLKGEMADYRECHIESDWILVYKVVESELVLLATGTGTHSDLFGE